MYNNGNLNLRSCGSAITMHNPAHDEATTLNPLFVRPSSTTRGRTMASLKIDTAAHSVDGARVTLRGCGTAAPGGTAGTTHPLYSTRVVQLS